MSLLISLSITPMFLKVQLTCLPQIEPESLSNIQIYGKGPGI
jgi:hypothetical protein